MMWVSHEDANEMCDAFSCAVNFAAHIKSMTSFNKNNDAKMFCTQKISMWGNIGDCDATAPGGLSQCVGNDRRAWPAGGSIKQVSVVTNV